MYNNPCITPLWKNYLGPQSLTSYSFWLSPQVLVRAFNWLRQQRKNYSIHDGTWSLSYRWESIKSTILADWNKGIHTCSPLTRYRFPNQSVAVFDARDSLLLKCLQLALEPLVSLKLCKQLYHVKGRGGSKAAVRAVHSELPHYRYVFKTDIQSFYDSIDHDLLLGVCRQFKIPPIAVQLIKNSLKRVEVAQTHYKCIEKGIARGSPLSPLLGAMMLDALDKAMQKIPGTYYLRYMDDWVVLCQTKTQLRQIVKKTHALLKQLKLTLHPNKTYIGKISKGFQFLGYHLFPEQLTIHPDTLKKQSKQVQQRYAQGASSKDLADYLRRFAIWCRAGMHSCKGWTERIMDEALETTNKWITEIADVQSQGYSPDPNLRSRPCFEHTQKELLWDTASPEHYANRI